MVNGSGVSVGIGFVAADGAPSLNLMAGNEIEYARPMNTATAEVVRTDGQRNGTVLVLSPIMLGIIPDIMPDALGCGCSTIRKEKTVIITANASSMKRSFLKVDTSWAFTLVLATHCSVVP
jgi:hypothetical protein